MKTQSFSISMSPRTRPSPFYDATVRYGVKAFTVYNHMLLPTLFSDQETEYDALVNRVAIWDVAAQRQVEIAGPDATALTQYLATRDISKMQAGSGRYTMICNHEGGILNDPVLLKLSDEQYWLSLADSDILLWASGIAAERGLDVTVAEPDVSPVQVQGPRSIDVIRDVFGEEIAAQRYYRFAETELDGVPMVVSRTGWSGEFGYEVWLRDGSKGDWLWERLFEAGDAYGALPGAPNHIRRVEGGMFSYGTDMDASVNPYEIGMGRLVDLDSADDFAGRAALAEIAATGPTRLLTGIRFEERFDGTPQLLPATIDGELVGTLTSVTWSPRVEASLGFVMLPIEHTTPGTSVTVSAPDGDLTGIVEPLPFFEAIK